MSQELNLIARVKSAMQRDFLDSPDLDIWYWYWYGNGLLEIILLEVDLKDAGAKRTRNEVRAA